MAITRYGLAEKKVPASTLIPSTGPTPMRFTTEFDPDNPDTSATGGPSVGGMGAVVSAQPSGLAGSTIGTNWASGGGTVGSGDVSIPYNPSGNNRVFQKAQLPMGKDHGPRTGKKSRTKKLDMKTLKNMLSKTQDYQDGQEKRTPGKPENQPSSKDKRVLDFNDFLKNDFNTIKK